jgi:two-component system, response regulator
MPEPVDDILLVEDNVNDADLSLYSLKKYRVANRIFHAHDGAEALQYIFGSYENSNDYPINIPRLILLDLKLPKIDGQEVLRKLKMNKATRSIPVVILTSSREERDIVTSYDLGVNSYIVKPIDFDKFSEAVRDIGRYWLFFNQMAFSSV